MDISAERHDGTLIVMASGRVDGSNAQEFHNSLESVLTADDSGVVLDFSELAYISSAGLRVVLLVAKTVQRQRARLVVCSLPQPIRELFEISGFDKIIPVHESRTKAVAGLAAD